MDTAAMVRVAKQRVRLALSDRDETGVLGMYLEELPVSFSTAGRPGRAGRAGFYAWQGDGDVGRVVVNLGVCYDEARLEAVLMHELAHAVDTWLNGWRGEPHGPTWRSIMVLLGQPPERCHNYKDRR